MKNLLGMRMVYVMIVTVYTVSCTSPNARYESTEMPENTVEATSIIETTDVPTATPIEPTAAPAQTQVSASLEHVLWQDSFDNQSSGWEPRYEVRQADYNMVQPQTLADTRLFAWNGYDNGGYSFYLPGIPAIAGETTTMLWDFNPTYQLPAYPYRVRADMTVNPAGNAMVLLDYVGDFGAIDKGNGLAIIWGQSDGMSYKYVDVWQLMVYEFHQGRTWSLGCSTDALNSDVGLTSSALVDVDINAVKVTVYGTTGATYTANCSRVQPVQSDSVRYLGIGAVYPRPVVPGNDYNAVKFDDVYVMSGAAVASSGADYQEITGGCVPAWMGYWDNEQATDVVAAIESQTDCRNGYASFSSDFPGYGPERIVMPDAGILSGNWACGGGAPTSRFRFWRDGENVMMNIGDMTNYVFYATGIEGHLRGYNLDDVPVDAYVVTDSPTGGNNQTFEPVAFVQIGDGIGARDQHHFYFTLDGDQIMTNWTVLPCRRE